LKSCDRILEAQKIIILEKIEGDQIFRVIENIEEIRYTKSLICHLSLSLVNNLNKTEGAIFHMQAMLPYDFPFYSD